MKRREFLKTAAAGVTLLGTFPATLAGVERQAAPGRIEKRALGRTGEMLSTLGFGALVLDDVAITSHASGVNAAVATAPTKLLVLDQIDFKALTARSPKLAAHIRKLARDT